jgi:hypothetical protein
MQSFVTINKALRIEPEIWASYFLGQKYSERASGLPSKPRFIGLLMRFVSYGFGILKLIRLRLPLRDYSQVDVLVIALTANQATSLATTVKQLVNQKLSVQIVSGYRSTNTSSFFNANHNLEILLNPIDFVKVLLLNMIRTPIIWRHLYEKDRRLTQWYFDAFLRCHIYLVYFEKLIALKKPKLILMSNDHNSPQRCLLSLAKIKGIKSAYLQHASVSSLFPALSFDYNFLDGIIAARTYQSCDDNKYKLSLPPTNRHIFLTGQKKSVEVKNGKNLRSIGYAIKALDDIDDVMKVVNSIVQVGCSLRLRWHPGTSLRKIEEIRKIYSKLSMVTISDPLEEPIDSYFAQIGVLVAANSSIHLEAAIAGVVSIYFEISNTNKNDYYGYVKNGISVEALSTEQLLTIILNLRKENISVNPMAIQAYSATYDTEWEGREGELVARIIIDLLCGAAPNKCWGYADFFNNSANQKNCFP